LKQPSTLGFNLKLLLKYNVQPLSWHFQAKEKTQQQTNLI